MSFMKLIWHTRHARLRMEQRNVTVEQVQHCVSAGTATEDRGRTVYTHDDLKVVVHKRTGKVVTVLTSQVHLLPNTRRLPVQHYQRIASDLGVHVHYDEEADCHELFGAPKRVQNAIQYINAQTTALRGCDAPAACPWA